MREDRRQLLLVPGGGFRPAIRPLIAAQLHEKLKESPSRVGRRAADRHGRQQWPAGLVVLPDQVFQSQGQAVDGVRGRNGGQDHKITIGDDFTAAGQGLQFDPQTDQQGAGPGVRLGLWPGAGQVGKSAVLAKRTPASDI